MKSWLSLTKCINKAITLHLPSPIVAQSYKAPLLYQGPQDSVFAIGMRQCDPKGPLMIYISKMIPTSNKERFFAFGRIFSGTIHNDEKVRIMGPSYRNGKNEGLYIKKIKDILVMNNKDFTVLSKAISGSLIALSCIDQYILKTATITNGDLVDNYGMIPLNPLAPLMKTQVILKNATDLPKLVHGLQKLSKSDLIVESVMEETGDFFISGKDEKHLEDCFSWLQKYVT